MSEQSPRLHLPFIIPGQAQKEHFHNEALVLVDLALHPAIEAAALNDPPASPENGQCWIVGAAPTGAWAGQQGRLAMWTEGGWRFVAPLPGMSVWDKVQGLPLRWTESAWNAGEIDCASIRIDGQQVVGERQPALASPSGGTVIDAEARAAIDAIVATLMSHGLID